METEKFYYEKFNIKEFKSYYVVWKQKNVRIDFEAIQRLNRTM